jgi:hypothetical protein
LFNHIVVNLIYSEVVEQINQQLELILIKKTTTIVICRLEGEITYDWIKELCGRGSANEDHSSDQVEGMINEV